MSRKKIKAGCKVPGCTEAFYAKDLCAKHYARVLRNGTTELKNLPGNQSLMKCSIDNCDSYRTAKGLCSRHYNRKLKTGDPLTPFKKASPYETPVICKNEDCLNPHYGKGFCRVCWQRDYRARKKCDENKNLPV